MLKHFFWASILGFSTNLIAADLGQIPVASTGNMLALSISKDGKIPLNAVFQMELNMVGNDGKPVEFNCTKVDARMPEHNHGMILRPVIKKLSKSKYEVSGMKLHMPGYWEILVDVVLDAKKYQLVLPYRL